VFSRSGSPANATRLPIDSIGCRPWVSGGSVQFMNAERLGRTTESRAGHRKAAAPDGPDAPRARRRCADHAGEAVPGSRVVAGLTARRENSEASTGRSRGRGRWRGEPASLRREGTLVSGPAAGRSLVAERGQLG